MCYPAPGPRCSNHAYKEYVDAKQKYELCTDANEKIILGLKFKDKEEAYHTTPRGQNELRRQADASTGLERDKLLLLKQAGEALRKTQLQDYENTRARKSDSLKQKGEAKDVKFGRYDSAVGIASLYVLSQFPESEIHVSSKDTLSVNEKKILVLPLKYQNIWEKVEEVEKGFLSENSKLKDILDSTSSHSDLSDANKQKLFSWFVDKLKEENYIGFAAVNTRTEDVAILPLDRLQDTYEIDMKLSKKLGGTTFYTGNLFVIEELIVGTKFEEGKVLAIDSPKKVVIYNVSPQAKHFGFLSPEIYLGWHKPTDDRSEGYYEVRKRHQSKNYNVIIKLKSSRQLFASAIDDSLKKVLK